MPIKQRANIAAIALLILLWALFFWRVITPIDADKAAFKQGDFSGQFVAFGAYQYERFTNGEIPLWNPYNNSGLPFIGDTQAAVFYPPRLLTIALAQFSGGWSYHALELEAIAHVLLYTLTMYALVQRLTNYIWSGVVAAVVGGYGGYLSGYPPLQLALLEAGVWLPLVILALHEAVHKDGIHWRLICLAGFTLGISWLAGHPQTSWFLTYLAVSYFAFQLWCKKQFSIPKFISYVALLGTITLGVTAITFIPGVEYLALTARSGMGFASKTNGFPLQDIIQFLYPGIVSLFNPLYVGVIGLIIALLAFTHPHRQIWFWGGVIIFGLLWSFGGNTALFDLLYNTLPGLRFFRGQERAAYLVANGLAILSGYGMATLRHQEHIIPDRRQYLHWVVLGAGLPACIVILLWIGFPEQYGDSVGIFTRTALILTVLYILVVRVPSRSLIFKVALVGLLIFELFTVNMDNESNYDNIPPANQLPLEPPPFIANVVPEAPHQVERVDGFRGLTANYGSLYGIYDARGISPLFLDGLQRLQAPPFASSTNFETNPRFWELNAVHYVYSGFDTLPVDAVKIEEGSDQYGTVYLYELTEPRPFAHLIYKADIVDSDSFALALLADPEFNPRQSIILHEPLPFEMPIASPINPSAVVIEFSPETFTINVNTPENAVLSVAHPQYPGWSATINGVPTHIYRAYSGFSAVAVPAGEHHITFTYQPLSFCIGLGLSLVTWITLGMIGIGSLIWRQSTDADNANTTGLAT